MRPVTFRPFCDKGFSMRVHYRPHSSRTYLLEGFLEGAPDGHRLPHTLHLGRQLCFGAGELLKCEAGDLQTAALL